MAIRYSVVVSLLFLSSIGLFAADPQLSIRKSFVGDPRTDIVGFVESIMPEDCGAAIARDRMRKDTPLYQLPCVIKGYRDMYMMPEVSLRLLPVGSSEVIEYAKGQGVKKISLFPFRGTYFYRDRGWRNVLLSIIADTESVDGERSNHYLWGYLFGYSEDDIRFLYERFAFMESGVLIPKMMGYLMGSGNTYGQWVEWFQKLFDVTVSSSDAHRQFSDDKRAALEWLQRYNEYSDEQLEKTVIPSMGITIEHK